VGSKLVNLLVTWLVIKKIYLEADPEISKGAPTALPKDRVDLLFNMPRVPVVPNVFWGGGGIRSRKKEEKNLLI